MTESPPVEMVWIDTETTGLNPDFDVILEVGVVLTDWEGEEIDSFKSLVDTPITSFATKSMNNFARDMHTNNHLLADLATADSQAIRIKAVEEKVIEFLQEYDVVPQTMPACGSSIHFDRMFLAKYMPVLNEFLHYRNIDISSLKETCKISNPKLAEQIPAAETEHRVFSCIKGSISEYQWYLDNFLHWER